MIGLNGILFISSAFLGSFVLNFISIHGMANLILTEGSSRSKSMSLSMQYALLTATMALIGVLAVKITGRVGEIKPWMAIIFVLTGDSGLVFLLKWWYTKKVYDTTYLFSFIIVEWIYLLLWMGSLGILNFL